MSDCELESFLRQGVYGQLLASPKVEESLPDDPIEEPSTPRKKQKAEEVLSKPKVKAQREKARREKMNQRFTSLAKLSNPEEPKTDKASILLDALVALKAIKVENDQLKQLNKFLEEKVGNYEKERSFVLYQQSVMLHATPDPFFTGHIISHIFCEQDVVAAGVMPETGVGEGTVMGMPVEEGINEGRVDAFLHPPAA